MTVSISKMSIDYYLESAVANDAEVSGSDAGLADYYTETSTPAGVWFGSGLAGVSMSAGETVTRDQAINLFEHGADPTTGERLGRHMQVPSSAPKAAKTPMGKLAMGDRQAVAGFDLTFSPPKSVSALWAMGDFSMQSHVEQAHRQAMAETFAWIESDVAQTRAGRNGVAHVPIQGLIGTSFDHWESRNGDPQLHSHAVISNHVQRASDGKWVTLDSYTLHRHVVAISETYNSLLYDRLHEQVGALAEARSPESSAALRDALDAETQGSGEPYKTQHRVELAGVSDRLIEEFSTRSVSIEARTDELVSEYRNAHGREPRRQTILQMRQQATLETRTAKDDGAEAQTLAQKKAGWRSRAIAAGEDPEQVIRAATGHPDTSIRPSMLDAPVKARLAEWALADASQQRATFTRANVVASSERVLRLVRCDSAEQRRVLVDDVVDTALDSAVALTPRRSTVPTVDDPHVSLRGRSVFDHQRHAGVWTTRAAVDAEQYVLGRYQDRTASAVDPQRASELVSEVRTSGGHALSADQAAATVGVLSSARSLDAVIGPAGTGKTTTMSALSQVWQDTHGDGSVIGLAPSAVAAGVLSDDLGSPTENTSKWLYESTEGAARRAARVERRTAKLERLTADAGARPSDADQRLMERLRSQLAADYAEQARYTMREGQLVIVDESSMVSTDHLHQLSRQAEEAGAKVVLVGDPAQLDSVDAGGILGHIDRNYEPNRLDMVWRMRHEWEREASLRLRGGEVEVLSTYAEHGRLHSDSEVAAVDSAYQAWKQDRDQGRSSILIASDNATVGQLNAQARMDLVEAGVVDDSTVVHLRDDVAAGAGDTLLARKNDRGLRDSAGAFVANGTMLHLNEVHHDGSASALNADTGASVELPATYLHESTELGYAVTAHRAQGVTVDTSHSVATDQLSRETFYVAMTRGREANHAHIDAEQDPEAHSPDHWGVLRETPRGQQAEELLEPVLRRSTAERTAAERSAAEAAYANDLGRMLNEREYLSWAGREDRTQTWVADQFGSDRAEQLRESPQWAALVDADPARTHDAETETLTRFTRHSERETWQAVDDGELSAERAQHLISAQRQQAAGFLDADPFESEPDPAAPWTAQEHRLWRHAESGRLTHDAAETAIRADRDRLRETLYGPADPTAEQTIDHVVSQCRDHDRHADPRGRVASEADPASTAQSEVLTRLDRDIAAERASQRGALEEENPQWFAELTASHADEATRSRAVDAAVEWRALSGQTDAATTLGDPPREHDRLRPHYDRAAELVRPRETWQQDTGPDPHAGRADARDPFAGAAPITFDPKIWTPPDSQPSRDRSTPEPEPVTQPAPRRDQEGPSVG